MYYKPYLLVFPISPLKESINTFMHDRFAMVISISNEFMLCDIIFLNYHFRSLVNSCVNTFFLVRASNLNLTLLVVSSVVTALDFTFRFDRESAAFEH